MIKKLTTVATSALLTSACAGPLCQSRGCQVVISDAVTKNGPVLFDFDSAVLTEAGQQALSAQVETIKATEGTVTIVGYTDITGNANYNIDLSQRRAKSAKQYFVEQGVCPKKITTKGLGATNFVADNNTRQGRAQNRRIEIEM